MQIGYNTAVAAADAVYSVIALLESHVGGWEYAFFNAYDSLSESVSVLCCLVDLRRVCDIKCGVN